MKIIMYRYGSSVLGASAAARREFWAKLLVEEVTKKRKKLFGKSLSKSPSKRDKRKSTVTCRASTVEWQK